MRRECILLIIFLHGPLRQRRVSEPRNLLHGNNKGSGSSSLFTLHAWRAEREISATVGKEANVWPSGVGLALGFATPKRTRTTGPEHSNLRLLAHDSSDHDAAVRETSEVCLAEKPFWWMCEVLRSASSVASAIF
ncbi:hypothetical protein CDAR_195651 [Caerostris darwini]|uniref:Secreted protein n=1 Tax=Caerostris darwini TaxID=1538125 RepID=A0AAV4Q6I8_9ARAC|nr:hypothetical protein CDAR_195651 [Caerostris darwini]